VADSFGRSGAVVREERRGGVRVERRSCPSFIGCRRGRGKARGGGVKLGQPAINGGVGRLGGVCYREGGRGGRWWVGGGVNAAAPLVPGGELRGHGAAGMRRDGRRLVEEEEGGRPEVEGAPDMWVPHVRERKRGERERAAAGSKRGGRMGRAGGEG
jgi:hypothetical protein